MLEFLKKITGIEKFWFHAGMAMIVHSLAYDTQVKIFEGKCAEMKLLKERIVLWKLWKLWKLITIFDGNSCKRATM